MRFVPVWLIPRLGGSEKKAHKKDQEPRAEEKKKSRLLKGKKPENRGKSRRNGTWDHVVKKAKNQTLSGTGHDTEKSRSATEGIGIPKSTRKNSNKPLRNKREKNTRPTVPKGSKRNKKSRPLLIGCDKQRERERNKTLGIVPWEQTDGSGERGTNAYAGRTVVATARDQRKPEGERGTEGVKKSKFHKEQLAGRCKKNR